MNVAASRRGYYTRLIRLNGVSTKVAGGNLTYEQIVALAGYPAGAILSVMYQHAPAINKKVEGILGPGQTLFIKTGTRIEACDTSGA